tara:strand:+ start:496 stop:837 length:342 start_codon:yes stop_codon:yes gene_type:complete
MGRVLVFLTLFLPFYSYAVDSSLTGLAEKGNISGNKVVKYVQSGINDYSDDEIVKKCLKKLNADKNSTLYALFNYIMYLDHQDHAMSKATLKETRKLIEITRYAKNSVNYCNS